MNRSSGSAKRCRRCWSRVGRTAARASSRTVAGGSWAAVGAPICGSTTRCSSCTTGSSRPAAPGGSRSSPARRRGTLERAGRQRLGRQHEPLEIDDAITVGATRLRLVVGNDPAGSSPGAGGVAPDEVASVGIRAAVDVGTADARCPRGVADGDARRVAGASPVVLGRRRADDCRVGHGESTCALGGWSATRLVPVGAPVVVDLARHRTLALVGTGGAAVARALVRQLITDAARPGVLVAVDQPGAWAWVAAFDHVTVLDAAPDTEALVRAIGRWRRLVGGHRQLVIVTDDEQLAADAPVRAVTSGTGALVFVGTPDGLACGRAWGWSAIAETGSRFAGGLRLDDGVLPTHFAGQTAVRAARSLVDDRRRGRWLPSV